MTLCKIKNVCEWLQLCKASLFVLITTLPAYLNCATCMLVTQMMAGVRGLLLCFTMLFSAGNCNGCTRYVKVVAETVFLNGAGQSPILGANPRLVIRINNTDFSAKLTGHKGEGSIVERTLRLSKFSPWITTCVTLDSIEGVWLQAKGKDGWYVASVDTFIAPSNKTFTSLSSDPNLNKWVDVDDESDYPYNAKLVPLTLTRPLPPDCITQFKISAQTGDLPGSEFLFEVHYVLVRLSNNEVLQAYLPNPAYRNLTYDLELDFDINFSTGGQCVKRSDITEVKLKAGGKNGWYIIAISTFVKDGKGSYEKLTEDDSFNKWLDGDEEDTYTYNATEHILSLLSKLYVHTPICGYGVPSCECEESADTCILNLEIDEIMTFTSYQKFSVGLKEGLTVRGTQGVIYNINERTGKIEPHPFYKARMCGDTWNHENCSDPQFVDGKTYRMAIGVNGQIPGPTLIVHEGQTLVINVHNNLSAEGISVHWHGMHQKGTPWMDGVGQVNQCQIGPSSTFTYMYVASPSGTFWYHSHSGAQRTDGFFGGLIVKERADRLSVIKSELIHYGVEDFEDLPLQHTISLLDWQHESSLETFSQLGAGLGFFPGNPVGDVPEQCDKRYGITLAMEGAGVGPVPYFSGLMNGKGRHNDVPYSKTRLSVFTVEEGKRYRFRLIGAQGTYAYKFSIDGHKLTVVGTDGYWIIPEKNVDFIIIHTGERYDFILEANAEFNNYWIRAETLEINPKGGPPYQSLGHVAEGILQYKEGDQSAAKVISSTSYEEIKLSSKPVKCTVAQSCRAINCPFQNFHELYYTECVNVDELRLLEETPSSELPDAYPSSDCPNNNCLYFFNFNFEGGSYTGSINARNYILPPVPPQTQNAEFQDQAIQCDLNADCNPPSLPCTCTHKVNIPHNKTVQFVLTSLGEIDSVHPIHVHGHTFHVVKVGYPSYDNSTGFIKKKSGPECNGQLKVKSVHNPDIECGDSCGGSQCPTETGCDPSRCTKPGWRNGQPPSLTINNRTIRKDTVMVPAGGYVVINFISDNPGYWFLHCHIEVHQLQGMALMFNEAPEIQKKMQTPDGMNKCGDFSYTVDEYMKIRDSEGNLAGVAEEKDALDGDPVY